MAWYSKPVSQLHFSIEQPWHLLNVSVCAVVCLLSASQVRREELIGHKTMDHFAQRDDCLVYRSATVDASHGATSTLGFGYSTD